MQIVHRVISKWLIKQARRKRAEAATGAVTLIQRFGSAANLNIPIHGLVLAGVFRLAAGRPEFHAVRTPTLEQRQTLLTRLIKPLMRLLTRAGYLVEEPGMVYLADPDKDKRLGAPASGRVPLPHCARAAGRAEGADLTNAPQPSGGGVYHATLGQ